MDRPIVDRDIDRCRIRPLSRPVFPSVDLDRNKLTPDTTELSCDRRVERLVDLYLGCGTHTGSRFFVAGLWMVLWSLARNLAGQLRLNCWSHTDVPTEPLHLP